MPKAVVLFDLDGTLMLAGGATRRAIEAVWRQMFGEEFKLTDVTAGRLDPEIFCELASECGKADPKSLLDTYKPLYLLALRRDLALNREKVRVLPGVRELLHNLSNRTNVVLGLLTGNYREGAQIKLGAAGIPWSTFAVGAFAEDGTCRSELVPAAINQLCAQTQVRCSPSHIILVGDTPRDIECAREAGCHVVAVSTGRYSLSDLQALSPDAAVNDLTDPSELEKLIEKITRGHPD